jgi:hypothetical protein
MSDSSDDEYAPIDIASWGSQAPSQSNNPAEEDTSKDWDSLLDSKIKVGANGIGSGQLHRKGTNFKPVGEDLILAQRLNKPVGKTQMQSAVREVELSLGLPPSKEKSPRNKKKPQMDNGTRKFSHKTSHSSTTNNNHRKQNSHFEVPSTIRVPSRTNSNDGGGSNWLQTSLVDTPFWTEKKVSTRPIVSSDKHLHHLNRICHQRQLHLHQHNLKYQQHIPDLVLLLQQMEEVIFHQNQKWKMYGQRMWIMWRKRIVGAQ